MQGALYTRLLGVNKRGREHLNAIRKDCSFPIIVNQRDKKLLSDIAKKQVEVSEFADTVYCLCRGDKDPMLFSRSNPIIID